MPKTKSWLLILTLVALSIRLWGIAYDLPYIYHPDEPWPIRIGYRMLTTGDFNPDFFHWPSFTIYLNWLIQASYFAVGKLLGFVDSPQDVAPLVELMMGVTYSPTPIIVLLGRMVTVLFGVGTVLITAQTARRLTNKIESGLLVGLMMALSPPIVLHNRFITPDTYATFFVSAVVLLSTMVLQQGKTRSYLVAGICIGLAASSKYNAGMVGIVLLVAHFLRSGRKGFRDYRLYLAFLLSVSAFLATTPYAVLDFPAFYEGLQYNSQHYSTGHAGMEGDTLRWYVEYLWKTSGGIGLAAMLGVLFGKFVDNKQRFLLVLFPALYFSTISSFVVRNSRTILPIIPFLFLLAAAFLAQLLDRANLLPSKKLRQSGRIGLACVMVAMLAFLAWQTTTDTLKLTTTNSRETARVWIAENLPHGAKIGIEAYAPFVDPVQFSVHGIGSMINHEPEWYIENDFDYLICGQDMYGRYLGDPERYSAEVAQYERFFGSFALTKQFNDGGYEVRIYQVR